MKNFIKLFGIIPLVAVIGFAMVACDNGGGGGGGGGGGVLVIREIPKPLYDDVNEYYSYLLIIPSETNLQQFLPGGGGGVVVAEAELYSSDIRVSGTNSKTLTVPLYTYGDVRWTESGSYKIFVVLAMDFGGYRYFGIGPVNFSSGTASVRFNYGYELYPSP